MSIRAKRIARIAALVAMLAVRLWNLSADPPDWLSWSSGVYTDEGFYTLDARHWVQFGHAPPGDFHDYLLAPALSALQKIVFSVFGAGIIPARLISVAFGMATVLALWLGLRRQHGEDAADAGAFFFGFAPTVVMSSRLALQETPAAFWLTVAYAMRAYAAQNGESSRIGFWGVAGALAGFSAAWKALALLGLPAIMAPARSELRVARLVSGIAACAVVGCIWLLCIRPEAARAAQMATYYRQHQLQPHSPVALLLNMRRAVAGGERGLLPYLCVTLPVPLLLLAWLRRERSDPYLLCWLAAGAVFCCASSYAPSRYYVLFLPALCGLAGIAFMGLPHSAKGWAIAAACVSPLILIAGSLFRPIYTMQSARARLAASLPAGSVLAGGFAPALCIGTPFQAAPVQPGLSNDRDVIGQTHATQVAVTRGVSSERWWGTHLPSVVRSEHLRITLVIGTARRHYVIDIYDVGSGHADRRALSLLGNHS